MGKFEGAVWAGCRPAVFGHSATLQWFYLNTNYWFSRRGNRFAAVQHVNSPAASKRSVRRETRHTDKQSGLALNTEASLYLTDLRTCCETQGLFHADNRLSSASTCLPSILDETQTLGGHVAVCGQHGCYRWCDPCPASSLLLTETHPFPTHAVSVNEMWLRALCVSLKKDSHCWTRL